MNSDHSGFNPFENHIVTLYYCRGFKKCAYLIGLNPKSDVFFFSTIDGIYYNGTNKQILKCILIIFITKNINAIVYSNYGVFTNIVNALGDIRVACR